MAEKEEKMSGLGEVIGVVKLVDVISKVFGPWIKLYFAGIGVNEDINRMQKMIEAFEKLGRPITDVQYEKAGIRVSSKSETSSEVGTDGKNSLALEERIFNSVSFQSERKQLRQENVILNAAENLKDLESVTRKPVDEDWITRFFAIVEDISKEEMHHLWGKILAGEIKKPGSYSLRTLEVLRNMSKSEADCFVKVSKFAIRTVDESFVFANIHQEVRSLNLDVSYQDLLVVEEAGLLSLGIVTQTRPRPKGQIKPAFIVGDAIFVLEDDENAEHKHDPQTSVFRFTRAGHELLEITNTSPDMDYVKYLGSRLKHGGYTVKYKTGIRLTEDGQADIDESDLEDAPTLDFYE